jgi:hypothetical protein
MAALSCAAQGAAPEPEIADTFYRLDNQALVPLERQTAAMKSSTRGFIVMSLKSAQEVPGAKSPVRFKSGQSLTFVVRSLLPPANLDPNTVYVLRKLTPRRDSREFVTTSGLVNPFWGSTTRSPAASPLPVEFKLYGQYSLSLLTPNLSPGEYALGRMYGPPVFCFGVD